METNTPEVKKTIFSGIQPSGSLTIGNYIGALRNFTLLQDDYNCIYCVVDMHAITVRQDPAQLRRRCLEVAATYIACGLDPKKNIIYCQSHVKHADNINAGLFDYPVLMAADILLYQADLVPIGADQKQHLELTRNIAQRFNSIYGDVFTVPEGYFGKVGSRIMSLQEPTRKMSKSDPDDCYIAILDPEDAIRRKIKRAVTDSDGEIRYDPENKPGVSNLLSIIAAMSGQEIDSVVSDLQGQGYGALKNRCTEVVLDTLLPIQAEHARLMADKGYLQSILDENAQRANHLAQKTLRKIQKKVGFAARG